MDEVGPNQCLPQRRGPLLNALLRLHVESGSTDVLSGSTGPALEDLVLAPCQHLAPSPRHLWHNHQPQSASLWGQWGSLALRWGSPTGSLMCLCLLTVDLSWHHQHGAGERLRLLWFLRRLLLGGDLR